MYVDSLVPSRTFRALADTERNRRVHQNIEAEVVGVRLVTIAVVENVSSLVAIMA